MEAVATEPVKLILEKLLEKLFAVASEEIRLVWGFKKEFENLKKYLKLLNEVLEDAAMREITDNAVKSWLKELEDAAYYSYNVLDEIDYEHLRRTIKPKGCLNLAFYTNITLAFQWKMAHKIKDINANFIRINNEADKLCLKRVTDYPRAQPPVIDTTSVTVDPIVIGRESDESEILETITRSINNVLSVLPIVGMGGIGKTTLARKIFNHPQTQNHFDKRIWVCVSKNFDQMTLFKRILELLLDKDFGGASKEAVVQKIQDELKEKRYLIILDDLWN
ncbi:putative disease resistance protein RGA4 [Olea europaea var. sylvestris]|uniref:putative disease resistance protein RGA4 n=1 Tax=Olea europaea var. sylvestris TaxID=158386 RepID=UPI000C1D4390|nr:putative disease resistance protein RGA4 [Olea europaea var. sylvestris]